MYENIDAERAALLPCPFCGNENVHIQDSYVDSSGFMVLCGNCTGEGPLCTTEKDAAAEWNRRTPSASIGEDGLPELPEPDVTLLRGRVLFTDGQMRQYARDAVAAERSRIADWYKTKGRLLDEEDVPAAILKGEK